MPVRGFALFTNASPGESICQKLQRQFSRPAFLILCVAVCELTLNIDRCAHMDELGVNILARLFSAGVASNVTYFVVTLHRRSTLRPTALSKIETMTFGLLERVGVFAPDCTTGPLVKVMHPQKWSTYAVADAAAEFLVACTTYALCLDYAGQISLPWEDFYSPFCIFGVIFVMCCCVFGFVRFKNGDDTKPYRNYLGCLVANICILGNLAVFTMTVTCIFMIMMWQYVGGPLEVNEHYKTFQKIDGGRNVKTPFPDTFFKPYEKGTTDEEVETAGFDREAPDLDPLKIGGDDDDKSQFSFQFEDRRELGGYSSFLRTFRDAFKNNLDKNIRRLKHYFENDDERVSGSVYLPSNGCHRRDVVRRMTVRWRGSACATHWSTSTQADAEAQNVGHYFDMRCFKFEGMRAWLRERCGLCEALLGKARAMIARPKPAAGQTYYMVLQPFLPCFDPFKPLPLLLFTEIVPPYKKMVYWSSLAKTLAVLKATRQTGMYLLLTLLDTLRYDWKLRVPQGYLSADGKRWNLNRLKIREAAPKFLILFIWMLWWILRLFWLSLIRGFGFRVLMRRPRSALELSGAIEATLLSARWRGG